MKIEISRDELRPLVHEIIGELAVQLDWPAGRIALTEVEAASACGVPSSVLRELRYEGLIPYSKLGRRIVYSRQNLLAILSYCACPAERKGVGQ